MNPWLPLSLAITSEVIATLCLEPALTHHTLLLVVVAGYMCAFYCLSLSLRAGMGLGRAYGTWSAVGVTLTALLAIPLFDDHLSPIALVGIALIACGVYLVQK